MRLFEYDELFLKLVECDGCFVDSETGEFFEPEEIEALEIEREKKQENVALWIKELKAEAEALKAEKLRLEDRQRTAEKRAESLTRYLASSLNGEKLSTSRVTVSYRKTTSVEIDDESLLPDEFFKIEKKVSKTAIKDALKNGEVAGAHIEEKQSVIIK